MRQDAMGCRGLPTLRSSHDGLTPAVIRGNTRLEDIESKMCSSGKRAISSIVAEIHTANKGTTFVYLIGLLEYHPEVWDQVLHTQSLANMFRKVELHAWPGWDGLIVGYDTNTQVYEIAVSNGEFDDAKKNEFDVKGDATYDGSRHESNSHIGESQEYICSDE
ncbi:hypothetical protein RI054_16g76760 [Pseudoscourfieldia marina]